MTRATLPLNPPAKAEAMTDQQSAVVDRSGPAPRAAVLSAVEEAIAGLDYGSIILTVHDARVVQLDVTRRRRFTD